MLTALARGLQAARQVPAGVCRDESDGGGTPQPGTVATLLRRADTQTPQMACRNANNGDTLLTVAIAPHQVYGPRDMLFLHNMLGAGNKLRVFGTVRRLTRCFFALLEACRAEHACTGKK